MRSETLFTSFLDFILMSDSVHQGRRSHGMQFLLKLHDDVSSRIHVFFNMEFSDIVYKTDHDVHMIVR